MNRDAPPTPAASYLASRLSGMMHEHRHVVAVLPYGNHVEIVWWTRKAGRPPPAPVVRDGVHVHYAETPGPIVDVGARPVGEVTTAKSGCAPGWDCEPSGFFAAVRALALFGLTAFLFYVLGKNKGARGQLFGIALQEVLRRVNR